MGTLEKKRLLSAQEASIALDYVTEVTIHTNYHKTWDKKRQFGKWIVEHEGEKIDIRDEVGEDTVGPDDPKFQRRIKEVREMLQKDANARVALLHGKRLGFWPYSLAISADYEISLIDMPNRKPVLSMDEFIEFEDYFDHGATVEELAEMFGLKPSTAREIVRQIKAERKPGK